ncbi:uncharacterized protein DS421_5g153080 [Arachis hypogaea]|nr:uncharacterized protein DS421_5g153080 [Arachis hypogaea]
MAERLVLPNQAQRPLADFVDHYAWVSSDVKDTPSKVTKEGLQDLCQARLLCGGGLEEAFYQVYVPAAREHVCQKNLAAPRVVDCLWVYEPMFTTLGVRLPFSPSVMGL